MTVQDSDITTLMDPPSTSSPRDTSFSLQVRLSHLLSFILTGEWYIPEHFTEADYTKLAEYRRI